MPELPEVETTLRGIQPFIEGSELTHIEVRNSSLRWPVPVDELQSLVGLEIIRSYRRAKYILLETVKGTMMLHLGMSGSVRILTKDKHDPAGKHDHIDVCFRQLSSTQENQEWILRYHDPRRFGSFLFVDPHLGLHPLLEKLGPEPLSAEFNGERLFSLARRRTIAIKNFIMNGHVVVGVGNIYASEALFMAGIRPTRQAGRVTKAEYQRLSDAIKSVLQKAIDVGGTTLRDFTNSDGQAGYFSQELNVYDLEGENCRVCDSVIKRIVIGQRSSFYCPSCQD